MDKEILGFNKVGKDKWEPVYECERGYIYTAAVVHCQKCGTFVRGMGGPMSAVCVECYNTVEQNK